MGKRALVTGADGFIGSHLVERLVAQGYEVTAFVYYNAFNHWGWLDDVSAEVMRNVRVIAGDIRDAFIVDEAVAGQDVIFHLAALIGIPFSYHAPEAYVATNITGTINVLQAARRHGNIRVVNTSTSEVYGTALYVPIDEQHPLQGQSPYSATKIAADMLAQSYFRSFDSDVVLCRPFNTYGPRQSARAIIPTIITQLLNGNGEVSLGSLEPTRDFNYVEDTVTGFIAVAEKGRSGEVYNIGSNYEISIGDLLQEIADQIGVETRVRQDPQRMRPSRSEVERLWAENAKAREELGWEPAHAGIAGLRKGLQKTIAWFSDPENMKKYKPHIYNV